MTHDPLTHFYLCWPCGTDSVVCPPMGLNGLWKGDEHPTYTPVGVWHFFAFTYHPTHLCWLVLHLPTQEGWKAGTGLGGWLYTEMVYQAAVTYSTEPDVELLHCQMRT